MYIAVVSVAKTKQAVINLTWLAGSFMRNSLHLRNPLVGRKLVIFLQYFVVAVEEAPVKQLDRSMRTDFHQISSIENYHSHISSASALILLLWFS